MHNFTKCTLPMLALVGNVLPSQAAEPQSCYGKPNVIFIMADQWRAQAFHFAGDENARTPNFDRFAAENIVFNNSCSCQPISSPARAALLSGQFSTKNGMLKNDLAFHPNDKTLGECFHDAGYQTGYIGKWHLQGGSRTAFIPEDRRFGFDFWKVMNCTHKYMDSYYWPEDRVLMKWDGYDAFAQADMALQVIQNASTCDTPFMMLLSWGPPHDPYQQVPEEYLALYDDPEKIQLRPNVPEDQQKQARQLLKGYYAHIAALDHKFGEILAALKKMKLMDNTIIVFYSDHGDMLCSQGRLKKSVPYEESVKVPLFMHIPGVGHKEINEPISTPDVMPTLLDLCDIEIPAGVQGRSFEGIIRGKKKEKDEGALIVWPVTRLGKGYGLHEYRALRTMRYTYVEERSGTWLLFDNEKDPYQLHNLAGDPACAKLTEKLHKKLQQRLKANDDEFLSEKDYLEKFNIIPKNK